MSTAITMTEKSHAVQLLVESGEYRILERVDIALAQRIPTDMEYDPTKENWNEFYGVGLFVDVETTGTSPGKDAVIQYADCMFTFLRDTGQIVHIDSCVQAYNDPHMPIPAEIVEMTGITDAMVAGQSLPLDVIAERVASCDIVIAHNARFDRSFLVRLVPEFETVTWGCSQRDVPWAKAGYRTHTVEFLATMHAGVFYDAHRADQDVLACVALLDSELADGKTALYHVLDRALSDGYQVFAWNSAFETKDALKSRGYSWDGAAKVWSRTISQGEAADESAWLKANVYRSGQMKAEFRVVSATNRYAS